MVEIRFDGPESSARTVVLAHGAGAPMDSPFLERIATGLAASGLRVARFEFPYMERRRRGEPGRYPDPAPMLEERWKAVLAALGDPASAVIGGKSLGGRIASMVADECGVRGLVCLGYPFHPPEKPDRPRTAHLAALRTRALIVQGTRDPFGTREEIQAYALSPAIRVHFLEDGDHAFAPRVRSGRTLDGNLAEAIDAVAGFVRSLEP
jgi:hypothetical protein